MIRWNKPLAALALAAFALAGCSDGQEVPTAPQSEFDAPAVRPTPGAFDYGLAEASDSEEEYVLYAGQDLPVGSMFVSNDVTNLYVRYEIDDPTEWCLTEVHLAVATEEGGVPQKNGNPIPGQFPYSDELDCEPSYDFPPIPLGPDVSAGDGLVIAGHAVVATTPFGTDAVAACRDDAVLFGIDRQGSGPYDSDLYAINGLTGAETEIFDVTDNSPDFPNAPNGLGYDADSGTWYWGDYPAGTGNATLYATDLAGQYPITGLTGATSGATVYAGHYYYGQQETRNIWRVDLATSAAELFCVLPETYGWGDMAISPDGTTLFASTRGRNGSDDTFFTVDLAATTEEGTCAYTKVIDVADAGGYAEYYALGMQIAFGANGVLYAVSTDGKQLYSVDTGTGLLTFVADLTYEHTDIASGDRCIQYETAWAADNVCTSDDKNDYGCDFSGKNWATYANYEVQGFCPAPTVDGDVVWAGQLVAGNDVARGTASTSEIRVFSETVGELGSALPGYSAVTQGVRTPVEVDEGTLVCSYYVILDPPGEGEGVTTTGSATFSGSALAFFGVKDDDCPDGCDAPGYLDDVLGVAGVTYTDDESLSNVQQRYYRWLETEGDNYDEVSISGNDLTMTLLRTNTTWWDAFRVLVTPSP